MKTVCVYHRADLDGHCSGAIVKTAHPDAQMIGMDYGDAFPWHIINEDTHVIMVDFSLQPWSDMEKLLWACGKLTWIDHHRSAISDALAWTNPLPGADFCLEKLVVVLDESRAACEIAWEHFMGETKMPTAVHFLGRYDVWDLKHPSVLPFQYGMRALQTDPSINEADFYRTWRIFLSTKEEDKDYMVELINSTILTGQKIISYQEKIDIQDAQALGFDVKLDGHLFRAFNRRRVNSDPFKNTLSEFHVGVLSFFMLPDGRWSIGMCSDKKDVDLGAIAKKHGGGGHPGAAGFQCKNLPWE